MNLGAVNSINWARVLAQITYYFWAYFRITDADPAIKTVGIYLLGCLLACFAHLRASVSAFRNRASLPFQEHKVT